MAGSKIKLRVRKPRNVWSMNPICRIKGSKKVYSRSVEKLKIGSRIYD